MLAGVSQDIDQSAGTAPASFAYFLEVAPEPRADALVQFRLAMPDDAQSPGLTMLGGDFSVESWCAPPEQIRVVVLNEADDPERDAAVPAERLYRRLIEMLRDQPVAYPLRLWNFFPGINTGDDDAERYRRFCIGRGAALEAAGLDDASMCAATAIGSSRHRMQLVALIGRQPGVSIENPRQVSAWNYPRRYGPRQPSFARATAVSLAENRVGLLVSGTASVVGHATAHPHDVRAQTEEAASNLEALLAHAAGAMNHPALARFSDASLARVYVRNAEDWPAVEKRLRARWPEVRLCGLQGDVCRRDLMVEIEAWQSA